MTVPGTTVGTQRNRVPATRRKVAAQAPLRAERTGRAGGRSGAALRAYERRQQRATVHTSDFARVSGAGVRSALNGSAIAARIPFVALVICMLVLGLGVTLLLTTRSAGDSYDLSAAKAVNAELAQQRASLQRDVELAESAPELARKAAAMGMVPVKNPASLIVATDGAVQVVGAPVPADGAPVAPLDPIPAAASGALAATNPGTQVSPAQQLPRSASQPSRPAATADTRAATPNTSNGAGNATLAEQLVPMSIPSAETPAATTPSDRAGSTDDAVGDEQ